HATHTQLQNKSQTDQIQPNHPYSPSNAPHNCFHILSSILNPNNHLLLRQPHHLLHPKPNFRQHRNVVKHHRQRLLANDPSNILNQLLLRRRQITWHAHHHRIRPRLRRKSRQLDRLHQRSIPHAHRHRNPPVHLPPTAQHTPNRNPLNPPPTTRLNLCLGFPQPPIPPGQVSRCDATTQTLTIAPIATAAPPAINPARRTPNPKRKSPSVPALNNP